MLNIRNRLLCVFILTASITIISPLYAVMPQDSHWYGDGNVGYSSVHKSYHGHHTSSGATWSIAVGYRFLTWLGAEVGYARYPTVKVRALGGVFEDSHYSYDFAGKLIFPFYRSGLELFGKAGIGRLNSNVIVLNSTSTLNPAIYNTNHYATSYYFGSGIEYFFLPNLAINGQWAHITGDSHTGKIDMYTLGFSVLFG